jgi:hypothetical protein
MNPKIPPEQEPNDGVSNEIWTLADAVCNGTIEAAQFERLNALLLANEDAARFYATYLRMHGLLLWSCQNIDDRPPSVPIPPIIVQTDPTSLFQYPQGIDLFSTGGFFFSYLLAAVIVGFGLLIGWTCQVSHNLEVAKGERPAATTVISAERRFVLVGRVTGMVNSRWADPATGTLVGAHVPLGRKYALASGMIEITYDTGARVILQGPCTYEVESKAGGYLSIGRLSALVEKKGEKAKIKKSSTNRPSTTIGHQPSLDTPLFAVRTPSAIVTDLGTEFGVDVDKEGDTLSQVFCGFVKMQPADGDEPTGEEVILGANQMARVEQSGENGARIVHVASKVNSTIFVRSLGRRAMNAAQARLLSEYDFEGNAKNSVRGAPDASVRSKDIRNLPKPYVAGKIGKKAIVFDGKSLFVDTGNGGYPNCTAGLMSGSYSFWINSTHTSTKEMVVHTSSKTAFSVRLNYDSRCNDAPGGIYVGIRSQAMELFEFGLATPSASSWADGRWHMITVTWTATTGTAGTGKGAIYIDGVPQAIACNKNAITGEQPFLWYKLPVIIGSNSSGDGIGNSYYLKGTLDDVAAWRGQLSEIRVKALYNLGNDSEINYGAKDEQTLANIFATQGAGSTSDGKIWQYAKELVGSPGEVLNHSAVILDGNGNGVQVVPPSNQSDSVGSHSEKAASTAASEKGGGRRRGF